ncbi:CheB methylesterase domain-containing protein [Sulfuricurvum sp.]|uniref:CheB methylesterase domain-containing protein n=1 Tax=Sulfuricurvum sp. TaxID=2025608 RepID=UPI003BB582C3
MIHSSKIILVGASAGGPGIIEKLLTALPETFTTPICIVQHFPADLTHSFVSRLQMYTTSHVVESYDGLSVDKRMIIVAKGGVHLGFRSKNNNIMIAEELEGIRSDFIPSIDAMMINALEVYEASAILAILLSGIGDDGVDGMVKIKMSGGMSICQDEKSSPVFGMPGRAIERGGVSMILSVEEIAKFMIQFDLI